VTDPIPDHWKKCNSCKRPIAFGQTYWVCNVSTCNRKRTGLVFCDVSCWDAHVPGMNHRESWAEERSAPSLEEWQAAESAPRKRRSPRADEDAEAEQQNAAPKATSPVKTILRRGAGSGSNP
jgi:hypothetical protein